MFVEMMQFDGLKLSTRCLVLVEDVFLLALIHLMFGVAFEAGISK